MVDSIQQLKRFVVEMIAPRKPFQKPTHGGERVTQPYSNALAEGIRETQPSETLDCEPIPSTQAWESPLGGVIWTTQPCRSPLVGVWLRFFEHNLSAGQLISIVVTIRGALRRRSDS
jgi:hypothetical protein